ncbi:DUF6191 domain-containing protein [Streptomyces sp. BPTC-684]|uniref:DUF6191 domain-containing protein n=1 Tax=Streptomyces sp. BPTC-684 TaxID=3043734 RepID=UPI0024B253E4|nr:DUF6191 domain-containing protein [Streptomyces sp. BPTC-684]WHM40831.1 DUF6191 domain-containing protein [Streptomyces sp. BPTC-684]
MGIALFMTLPGLVLALVAMIFIDQIRARLGRAPQRGRVSATGFEQLQTVFSAGKESELKERQSALMLKDDEEDGAPPHRSTVDLDSGQAVIRLPKQP